jgi:Phosphatidylinositol-specific phospholipase C, X domain
MAHHMKTIFKGTLLLPGKSDIGSLPSPEELKGKIILKGMQGV